MAQLASRSAVATAALLATALPAQEVSQAVQRTQNLGGAVCAPGAAATPTPGDAAPVLLEGLGNAGIEADSKDPQAQAWFRQGVRLIWAFDEVEAVRAFQQAQKLDPSCSLCFWGEAWARGPTINLRPRTDQLGEARTAAGRASRLASRLSRRDKLLVKAMVVRTAPADAFENVRYADTLEAAAARMPADDLVATLAADARMVAQAPNQFKPGSLTQRLLERVMERNPDHNGAIHYYIHLTDWIDRQHLAVKYAERLGTIAPAASHLVHMPSHTFYGVGRYADAASVNVKAIAADNAFIKQARPAPSAYRAGLLAHNMHFAINSALARGDGETALRVSQEFRERFSKGGPSWTRIIGSAGFYADGLHGDPAEILKRPAPSDTISRAFHHYARGEALARKGDAAGVRAEAAAIENILNSIQSVGLGGERPKALVEVTLHVLQGRAAMLAGNPTAAADAYFKGMQRQAAAQFSSDPPLFWYSVRRSYAAALIAGGEHARAREHLLASLSRWPNDPLALYALSKVVRAGGDDAGADRILKRARTGWKGNLAEVPLAQV
jgi:hypothetical protein